jgi:iron complex transport system substrate-binding protein
LSSVDIFRERGGSPWSGKSGLQTVIFTRFKVTGFVALLGALLSIGTMFAQAPAAQTATPQPGAEKPPAGKAAQTAAQSPLSYRDVTDEMGRLVRVPQPVERIVSLAPSLTETVYALGLQDRLVGDTDYCDYPPAAQKKQKVGGAVNPSIEEVAALHPDLVLVTKALNRPETVRALDDLKIASYATDPHTVQEIISSTTKLADVLGAAAAGASLAEDLQQRLADLKRRIGELPPRRVLFIVWTEPLITVGKGTFIADAMRKAGGISIVDVTQDWPQLSLEEVVRLQPEFLVIAAQHEENTPSDLEALAVRPGWRSLEAVKNRRFAVISDAVNRPAPRIVSAIEDLARQLHPEAFQEAPSAPPASGGADKLVSPASTSGKKLPAFSRSLSTARDGISQMAEACACSR